MFTPATLIAALDATRVGDHSSLLAIGYDPGHVRLIEEDCGKARMRDGRIWYCSVTCERHAAAAKREP